MMGIPASQRRILTKTENAIRACDPRLASILDIFSWLNRDEELPPTEQVSVRWQLNPRLLPRRGASCREAGAGSLTRYVAILFYLLVVAAWVSWIVMVSASGHSASCPAAAMVARHDANITTCKLAPISVQLIRPHP